MSPLVKSSPRNPTGNCDPKEYVPVVQSTGFDPEAILGCPSYFARYRGAHHYNMNMDEPSRSQQAVRALWASIADRDVHLLRLLESIAQIVWVTDERGNVLGDPPPAIAHLTWSAFTGISQEAMQGQGWLAAVHPEDMPGVTQLLRHAILHTEPVHTQFRVRAASGEWRWMSARGNPIRDAQGRVLGWIGTCTDITVGKQVEEALRQAQKVQALGTLAAGIAHDFNNLLLAVDGNARLVLADLPSEHSGARSLQEIVQVSQRGVDLVHRILAFAAPQPQSGATASLLSAIDETLSLLRPSVPQRMRVVTRFPEASPLCALSATEVQQIVVNLVNNAVQAIGEDAGDIEIIVESDTGMPGFVQLRIRDTGCGMDEAIRSRIFDPFFTTKPAGKGTGLGLAVVHGIVQSCGGSIEVTSDIGRGTTLSLSLPLSANAVSENMPASSPSSPAGAGEHLLYVDDDENVVFLIEHWFKRQGYRVSGFTDPGRALAAFTADPGSFDVVITDLSMPRMNGFDFARGVKAVRADVPVVMTSGFVREQDEALARSIGIAHLILKPNTIDALAATLQTLFATIPKRHALSGSIVR